MSIGKLIAVAVKAAAKNIKTAVPANAPAKAGETFTRTYKSGAKAGKTEQVRRAPTTDQGHRVANAASTSKWAMTGKLPGSLLTKREIAKAANPKVRARTLRIAKRMAADPDKAGRTLKAVQRGAEKRERRKVAVAGAALTAASAGLVATHRSIQRASERKAKK